jgi:hypothetical protein
MNKSSWRDWLPIHPDANEFDLLPKDQLQALAADIRANNNLREPCTIQDDIDGNPVLLDGRNRLDALELLGHEIAVDNPNIFFKVRGDVDPVAYIVSKNVHRRHLSAGDRQRLLIKLIAKNPEKSDRQHAQDAGVDHHQIARARAKGEDVGRVSHVAKRTDAKGRRQPATKLVRKLDYSSSATPPINIVATEPPRDDGGVVNLAKNEQPSEPVTVDMLAARDRVTGQSAKALAEFKVACRTWIPKITLTADLDKARALISGLLPAPKGQGDVDQMLAEAMAANERVMRHALTCNYDTSELARKLCAHINDLDAWATKAARPRTR